MPFTSDSILQQQDATASVGTSAASVGSGGGGASSWDQLTDKPTGLFAQNGGNDGYSETNAPTYDTSGPSAKGPLFTGAGEDIEWRRDPGNDIALEVRDTTNGNRLLWLDDNGRLHTRRDQEAFADGAGSAAPGTNSLLQVEDAGTVLTTDAASLDFTGSAVSATTNGDDVTVDISGGGSPTDILEGGTEIVADATDVDFDGNHFNVTDEGSGEAGVALQNDSVTVAGNQVSLGGNTAIAHGDLSDAPASAHHTKTTSASDLTDVSPDSVSDAHHAKYTDSDAVSAINSDSDHGSTASHNYYTDSDAVSALQSHDGTNVNADTLDGVEGGNYARTDQDETFQGSVTLADTSGADLTIKQDGTADRTNSIVYNGPNGVWWARVSSGNWELRDDTNNDNSVLQVQLGAGADSLVVTSTGVGVDIANPSYAVEVGGDVRSTGEQEAFLGSDERLKTDITPIGGALDKVCQIGGYGFRWHEEDAVQPHKRGEQDVGVIAQEVVEVCPEAVTEFGGGHSEGYQAVNYDRLVPLLIEAVKDLRSQVNKLR